MTPQLKILVFEIDAVLNGPIDWTEDKAALAEHGATAYSGVQVQNNGGGWRFLIVEYAVDGEEFATGTASRLGQIVRLTPELSAKALKKAKAAR